MRNWWRKQMLARLQAETAVYHDFHKTALILAPHPDDETLGCGGLIRQKRQAGAQVWVVFVSDGRHSHSHLMPALELAERRHQEALAACAVLGVDQEHVIWLGVEDGQIQGAIDTLQPRIRQLLQTHQPDELFIPLPNDGPSDHEATAQLGLAVATNQTIYGYPIWAWHHAPYMPPSPFEGWRGWGRWARRTAMCRFGYQLRRQLTHQVDVTHHLQQKKKALAQHQTQMSVLQTNWFTLQDVPQFLATLLTNREYLQKIE